MKLFRHAVAGIALAAALFATEPIEAAGVFVGFPNPTTLTGQEVIPMDTGAVPGLPQTVLISLSMVGGSAPMLFLPEATGFLLPVSPNGVGTVVISPNSLSTNVLATGTIVLPQVTQDGEPFRLCSTGTITSLTVNSSSGSQSAMSVPIPTALTVSTTGAYCYEWVFSGARGAWVRLQ